MSISRDTAVGLRARLGHLAIAGGLALTTCVVYLSVRSHEFVDYDDPIYITENPNLPTGLTPESVWRAFREPYETNWIPLTWISLQVDYALFGLEPAGYHAMNVALHALAAALLFLALVRLTRASGPSLFVAAVFALHPLRVESVAWAAERKDTLSGVFFMLTLLAYTAWARGAPSARRTALLLLCFAAGLLAKPMLVTLPLVLLLLDFWPLGRLAPTGGGGPALRARAAGLIVEKLPLLAMAAGVAAITLAVQAATGAMPTEDQLPFPLRAMNALESFWIYIFDSVWPSGLAIFYPHPLKSSAAAAAVGAALAIVVVTGVCVRLAASRPYLLVGWLWYGITLLPVIGLVQVGMQARADRYTYLPQIGLAIALAWGVRDLVAPSLGARRLAAVSGGLVVAALAFASRAQLATWQDTETLYRHAIAVTERNFLAHHGLAVQLLDSGRLAAAEEHFAEAVALKPRWPGAHLGLADVRLELGQLDAAVAGYRRAVALAPRNPTGHAHLAQALAVRGDLAEAAESFRTALELYGEAAPAEVHAHLASVLARQDRLVPAQLQYLRAIERRPTYEAAHANLGILLVRSGRYAEARASLEHALALGAETAEVHDALAAATAQLGDLPAAVRHLREALRLRPEWPRVANNLAWILATHPAAGIRDPATAVELAEALCARPGPTPPDYLDTLAASYAAAGRNADAVAAARRAVARARELGRSQLADEIAARLAEYEAGRSLSAGRGSVR